MGKADLHIDITYSYDGTANASLPNLGANRRAQAMAARLPLTPIGCSDAHLLWMIGAAATQFTLPPAGAGRRSPGLWMIGAAATPFTGRGSQACKLALQQRATSPVVYKRTGGYIASHLKAQLLRMMGLAHWSPTTPWGADCLAPAGRGRPDHRLAHCLPSQSRDEKFGLTG